MNNEEKSVMVTQEACRKMNPDLGKIIGPAK